MRLQNFVEQYHCSRKSKIIASIYLSVNFIQHTPLSPHFVSHPKAGICKGENNE